MKKYLKVIFVVAILCMFEKSAYAADGGFTEIAGWMDNVLEFLTGRYAFFICVVSWGWVLGQWAFNTQGENMLKTSFKLAVIFALFFNLVTVLGRFFSASLGMSIE